jgi:Ca-activated chloride channel family protein
MARAGLGESFVVLNAGEAAKQAARFRNYIATPVLTDIKVDYEGFQAYDAEPKAVPDLFALRPITILGKYRGSPAGAIVVRGKTAQGTFEQKLNLGEARSSQDNAALRLLWARQRIMNLADFASLERDNQEVVKEVTALGLKYSLMTPYTSFVAVDKVKRADGQLVTVKQPLPLPEGVSDLAVGQPMPAMAPAAPWDGGMMASRLPEAYVEKMETTKPGHDVAGGSLTPGGDAVAKPAVTITIQRLQAKGGLSPADVKKVLESEVAILERCCQEAAKQGSKLPGTITLVFTVGTDGKVSADPIGKPPLVSQGLENCLVQAFRILQFPGSQKITRVTVTLALKGR